MPEFEKPVFRFAAFTLEPAERRLSEAGKSIALTPKVFETLVLLVERAGHVVSKDELMKLVWPRGYVDESNLTKHIWLIRRALGDGEHDSRFIETVPKVGYRFVAPVVVGSVPVQSPATDPPGPVAATTTGAADIVSATTADAARATSATTAGAAGAASATTTDTSGAASATTAQALIASSATAPPQGAIPNRRWLLPAILVAAVLLLVGWWLAMKPRVVVPFTHRGHTIALVGFSNLSRNPKDAWLAPALSEMLGAELSVAENLQVVPDELVRDASSDLSAPAAGGYSLPTLARLRQRLDADYAISGSYLVAGSSDDAPLRVDIALQDTRTGAVVVAVSNQSPISGLIALATQAGTTLRDKVGARAPNSQILGLVANVQPPNLDVARRLGFAIDALQHYDPARARDELLEAVAEAPDYAPAYTYLAQAWSALGYREKALAAAEQAAQKAINLPPEQRLQTEAVVQSAHNEWTKAAGAWLALARLRPASVEYRLQAIDAQIAAGSMIAAQASLHELQRLPGAADDPRVELATARVAGALDDARGTEQHAAAALRLAQRHDAAGLIADAELTLAGARTHLNQNEAARANLIAAIDAYRSIRNPRGEATARSNLAHALSNLKRNQEAREEFERAMELDRSTGDLAGIAGVYRDLCSVLWLAGDRDGAQAAARDSLALARQTGDLMLQSWTLQALATIAADDAASDEVLDEYREVAALNMRTGHQSAWPLANIADVQRMRGELEAARATCARAFAMATPLSDPQFAVFSGFICALIEVDRGDAAGARAGLEEVLRRVGSGGDTTYRDNSLMVLAQLDIDEGHWNAARERLQQASRGFAAAEERTGEAEAEALLALCAQVLGDAPARDQALQRARTLRQSMTSRQEVYIVDITIARLGDATHAEQSSPEQLLVLAADAERRQWLGWALEAKLAAWELLSGRHADGAAKLRQEIQRTAAQHGYGRILKLLTRGDHRSGAVSP